MRIGFNVIRFAPQAMGGIETYIRNLVRSLQDTDTTNEYLLLCDSKNTSLFHLHNSRFTCREMNFAKPSLGWFARSGVSRLTGFDILRPVMDRLDVDVIHHPFNFLDPGGSSIPAVVTFLDIQQEYYPEFFPAKVLRWRAEHYPRAAREAARIIAISEYVKRTIVERYSAPPEKIDVVYPGHGPEFRVIDDDGLLQGIKHRYELDRPFMFYPAATWPHKNHIRLLAAMKLLKERGAFDGKLVLTGIRMQSHRDILGEIEKLGLGGVVRILGYLPDEDLPSLYNIARMVVFPSLYEGFGIPLVEAMACGCPVVCANVTSIPEVVADAGEFFDPLSVEMMAAALWNVWNDDGLRLRMSTCGLERARLFNWEKTARKTIDTYAKAIQ